MTDNLFSRILRENMKKRSEIESTTVNSTWQPPETIIEDKFALQKEMKNVRPSNLQRNLDGSKDREKMRVLRILRENAKKRGETESITVNSTWQPPETIIEDKFALQKEMENMMKNVRPLNLQRNQDGSKDGKKMRVLFLDTAGSSSGIIALAWVQHLHEKIIDAFSASFQDEIGITNPMKIQCIDIMKEVDCNFTGELHTLSDLKDQNLKFDVIVTLNSEASNYIDKSQILSEIEKPGKSVIHLPMHSCLPIVSSQTDVTTLRELRETLKNEITELPNILTLMM